MISFKSTLKTRLNGTGIASTSEVHIFVCVAKSAKDGM
jgi:hypothetical protein